MFFSKWKSEHVTLLLKTLLWPPRCTLISWSGPLVSPVSACTIFAFCSHGALFLLPLRLTCLPSQGLGAHSSLLMQHSSTSLPLTIPPSNLSSSVSSSGSHAGLPSLVTFSHCQASLVYSDVSSGETGVWLVIAGYCALNCPLKWSVVHHFRKL